MARFHLAFLGTALLLVVLMATQASGARTTARWPKHQSTKKPPRAGSSGGGRLRMTTTTNSGPSSSSTVMEETTESMTDSYTLTATDSTTYSNDGYPTDFPVDAVVPPGVRPDNFTIDLSQCFYNVCECCPPAKGVPGPPGDTSLTSGIKQAVEVFMVFILRSATFIYLLITNLFSFSSLQAHPGSQEPMDSTETQVQAVDTQAMYYLQCSL